MCILYQFKQASQAPRGFTLLEMLIAMTLLVVLSGLGVPQLSRLIDRQRITSAQAELRASLDLARGEAIRRAAQVSVCRRAADSRPPACASGGRDWNAGWIVFVDRSFETGSRDPVLGEILQIHEPMPTQLTISFSAPRGASLTYDGQGWPDRNFVGGSFRFCSKNLPTEGRRLVTSRLGRIRSEKLRCSP